MQSICRDFRGSMGRRVPYYYAERSWNEVPVLKPYKANCIPNSINQSISKGSH